jgi:hypothetical protein
VSPRPAARWSRPGHPRATRCADGSRSAGGRAGALARADAVGGGARLGRRLQRLRRALFDAAPGEAGFWIADGLTGTAIARGRTVEEASQRWREAVWRAKPRVDAPSHGPTPDATPSGPLTPPPPSDEIPRIGRRDDRIHLGTFHVRIDPLPSAVPMPPAVPDTMPAGLVWCCAPPAEIPTAFARAGFERWIPLVGGSGRIAHALIRQRGGEVTLVGAGVLDIVDPAQLDARIGEAIDDEMELLGDHFRGDAEMRHLLAASRWSTFHVWDPVEQAPTFRVADGTAAHGVPIESLDGDRLRWAVGHFRP